MSFTWLTVDLDDKRHVPRYSGHPTRSRHSQAAIEKTGQDRKLSDQFRQGMRGFERWLRSHTHPVTMFVIADLFNSEDFSKWFQHLLEANPNRLTIGCHGLHHKSWSAWPKDKGGFAHALNEATSRLKLHAGVNFRPWFRAPGGYMAPWMSSVLAEQGYTVDSSINPSWLVRRKAGKGNSWNEVADSLQSHGIVSRPWKTKLSLPVNGPALFLFPLSLLARRAWRQAPMPCDAGEVDELLLNVQQDLTTLYWHLLDHARNRGKWMPPLR